MKLVYPAEALYKSYTARRAASRGAAISSGLPIQRTIPSFGEMMNATTRIQRGATRAEESFIKLGNGADVPKGIDRFWPGWKIAVIEKDESAPCPRQEQAHTPLTATRCVSM